jgi:Fic family protein
MARYEHHIWPGDPTGQSRRDREPFPFQAYVPDEIADTDFPLSGPVAQAVTEAELSLADLNRDPPVVDALEAVARQLLRAESVASSRIEGLELSHRRLARADYEGEETADETARSVLGNIRAMERAVEIGEAADPFRVQQIRELHEELMTATRDAHLAGRIRDRQSWLGGSTFSPRAAEFIPPPPEYVEPLLEDLGKFLNRDDMPAVQQAAIVHAQFETIHPFEDGNGRVGRCLIHCVLRRRQVAPRYVPPISLVLATHADDYIRGLTAYREERQSEWSLSFARTTSVASREAAGFAARVSALQDEWRTGAGRPRRGSAASRLIDLLPRQPIVDAGTAHQLLGGSQEAVRLAIRQLERGGVLQRLDAKRRNAAWEAVGLYDALDVFERKLATTDGEHDPPRRPAPRG